jgi:hypothetical protein
VENKNCIHEDASGKTIASGKGEVQICRYDLFRSGLLDALRRKRGGRFIANRSMIVKEALDRLLMAEGLLPKDAPLVNDLKGADGGR